MAVEGDSGGGFAFRVHDLYGCIVPLSAIASQSSDWFPVSYSGRIFHFQIVKRLLEIDIIHL